MEISNNFDKELFIYQVVISKDFFQYIIAYSDQIPLLLNHPHLDRDKLFRSSEIIIKKLGPVLINPLTLDRLISSKT